jgi:lipid II:glycine glycyltransferase (peptidoglycan interpeptide bridge formation enzyme)
MDLTQSDDDLLDKMHHKTRYNIKVAEKYGITVRASDDLNAFWELLKKTTKRDRFSSHAKDYYEKLLDFFGENREMKTDLILAYHDRKPVAGAIILYHGQSAYYLHGASDYDARKLMAPHKLHWEIINKLKVTGYKFYDLWGINARHWPGVTRFKLGWGGRVVEYPGSFDWRLSWWWYQSYKLARKIF